MMVQGVLGREIIAEEAIWRKKNNIKDVYNQSTEND